MKQSRRDVLRAGAGIASAGVLSSLAGCGALPGGGGGGGLLGGGGGAYSNWLVAPGEVGLGDNYSFFSLAPATLAESEEFSDEDTYDTLESSVEDTYSDLDLDAEDIDTAVSLGGNAASLNANINVVVGSFTVEDLVDELEDNDYDDESELDNGTQIFVNESGSQAVAVNSSYAVIMARQELTAPARDADAANPDVRSISYGDTITSRIDDDDPDTYTNRGHHDPITFQGSEGDVVTIEMVSNDDTYLQLEGPNGTIVTENDDGGSGLNSTIDSYELSQNGEYTIIATSFSSYDTFTYRLRLTEGSGADQLVSRAETFVGVQSGDTASYTDESDVAADVVDALGGGDILLASIYEPEEEDDPENGVLEDSVASGLSFSENGDVFDVTGAVVYDSESDADDGDVEDWADDGTSIANGNLDDVSVSTSGRVVTFEATVDIDDLV